MPYEAYKIMHYLGIFLTLTAIAGVVFHVGQGGSKEDNAWRKFLGIQHGVGLLLVLVAGFGLLARLGLTSGLPGWIYVKLLIWFILGAFLPLAYKFNRKPMLVWYKSIALAMIAATFAVYKFF